MRNTWAVARREFVSYFVTPVGYVVLATYTLISGLAFAAGFIIHARATQAPSYYDYSGVPDLEETMISPHLVFCGLLFMLIGPLVTMRLLAEERNRGTMELLLTYPLRDRDIIFGKYLAALGMLVVAIGVIACHMALVFRYADVEPAVLAFGLLTVFLMGSAFLSLGLFISAVTGNQITAATITFGVWFVSYVLGVLGKDLPESAPVPPEWGETVSAAVGFGYGIFRQLVTELPLDAHAREMAQGVFTPADIVYYLLFAAFFLFLTFRALEWRAWRA